MRFLIFDFEVFKEDTLLGVKILDGEKEEYYQTWSLEEITKFYYENKDDAIWIGHNNKAYDNLILQAIVKGKTQSQIKLLNDAIIRGEKRYLNIPLIYYDLISNHFASLKTLECVVGKNISESGVDFDLDRKLTYEEKLKTESYNKDDLDQTYDDFKLLYDEFQLRLDMIKEFNLQMSALNATEAQIASMVLGAHQIEGIENQKVPPIFYENLKIKNQDVLNYYFNETFKTDEKFQFMLCGVKHQMGNGGLHGAKNNYWCDEALYLDVSGYYNLIMILFNLFSRTIPEEGIKKYTHMYYEQLELKKLGLKQKRQAYKVILLAVWGAMKNKYTDFYDVEKGSLITITGQLFLIDLLEKMEGKIDLIQSNTDGIMVKPLEGHTKEEILDIVKEWCDRTGFVIEPKTIYHIIQRDVNNYLYLDDKQKVHTKGEALKHYAGDKSPFDTNSYQSKEPLIIAKGIVNYLVYNISPEQTVEGNKNNLRLFQYICKKNSFDWLELETIDLDGQAHTERLQNVNRAFASNSTLISQIYKRKIEGKKDKYQNLPNNVFVWNKEILSKDIIVELSERIDYNYYVKRIYERILEFLPE